MSEEKITEMHTRLYWNVCTDTDDIEAECTVDGALVPGSSKRGESQPEPGDDIGENKSRSNMYNLLPPRKRRRRRRLKQRKEWKRSWIHF